MAVKLGRNIKQLLVVVLLIAVFIYIYKTAEKSTIQNETTEMPVKTEANIDIDPNTGLIQAEGLSAVVNNCTQCHSTEIIEQNRLSAEQWRNTIHWMQETQNLWDLGEQQDIIINYLVSNYPVVKKGRRQPLSDIEWYELKP